ncbi:MAG: hypothetical protein HY956_01940 [Deltaproteobacteria bacterium]|nr:hypothetical protein [Deltaproteobacteria bacterium]
MNTEKARDELIKELDMPLFQAKGWMKITGISLIILGILNTLSIIGILWGWLLIWMGIILYQAASRVEEAEFSGKENTLAIALQKLKTFFIILGVLSVIGIIALILMFVIIFIVGIFSNLSPVG